MTSHNNLLGKAGVYLGATVLNASIPFLLLPILTRVLTPADYGIVAMFTLLLTVFGAFTGLSVHGAVSVRFFQLTTHQLGEYIASCVMILACSTVSLALLVALLGDQIAAMTGVPADWLLVAVAISGLQFVINIRLTLWQVSGRAKKYGAFLISQSLVNAIASLVLILIAGLAWQGRLLGQVIAVVAFAALALWLLFSEAYLRRPAQWRSHVQDALRFGVPLIPHVIGGLLTAAADRIIIVNYLDVASAGVYMVALQVGQVIGLLTDAFNKAYSPWLMKKLSNSETLPGVAIVRGTYLYFAVVMALGCVFGLSAPLLLRVLVGQSFQAAGPLVFYIALGYAFGGCYFMVTNYVLYQSRTGLIAAMTLASGAFNVALAIALVPRYGLQGAGLSFVASNALMFFGTWWLAQRVHPMPWLAALRAARG